MLVEHLKNISDDAVCFLETAQQHLADIARSEKANKFNELCANYDAEKEKEAKMMCEDETFAQPVFEAFQNFDSMDSEIKKVEKQWAAAGVLSTVTGFNDEEKKFLTKKRHLNDVNLKEPGTLLGNMSVVQAKTRVLKQSETRSHVLGRAQKFLDIRDFVEL